ncbi:MAG: TfoX/Sxy family protein [Anaerolineae bacterium]
MAKEYLGKLSAFIDKATSDCFDGVHLECKHFFSGAALYADEKICISLTPVGLALKLPEETKNRLLKNKSAVPLRYFPKGPIKKDYVLFSTGIENDGKTLHKYVKESVEYALTLPKPKRKQK